jgi:hypothetical protein
MTTQEAPIHKKTSDQKRVALLCIMVSAAWTLLAVGFAFTGYMSEEANKAPSSVISEFQFNSCEKDVLRSIVKNDTPLDRGIISIAKTLCNRESKGTLTDIEKEKLLERLK